jgi:hypothetical protein
MLDQDWRRLQPHGPLFIQLVRRFRIGRALTWL